MNRANLVITATSAGLLLLCLLLLRALSKASIEVIEYALALDVCAGIAERATDAVPEGEVLTEVVVEVQVVVSVMSTTVDERLEELGN